MKNKLFFKTRTHTDNCLSCDFCSYDSSEFFEHKRYGEVSRICFACVKTLSGEIEILVAEKEKEGKESPLGEEDKKDAKEKDAKVDVEKMFEKKCDSCERHSAKFFEFFDDKEKARSVVFRQCFECVRKIAIECGGSSFLLSCIKEEEEKEEKEKEEKALKEKTPVPTCFRCGCAYSPQHLHFRQGKFVCVDCLL